MNGVKTANICCETEEMPLGNAAAKKHLMAKKRKKLRGTVEKIIRPLTPTEPEKAEITIDEADDLYREIRIENVLTDEKGEKVRLKPEAKVDVVVEADSDATTKKPERS